MIETMHGKGMKADDFDDLLEREALQSFDNVLLLKRRRHRSQALSHGNVDHRVLGVTKQLLVRATHGS